MSVYQHDGHLHAPIPGPREAHRKVFPQAGGRECLPMKNDFPRMEIPESLRRKMVEAARESRKAPTASEHILWQALRGKRLDGLKFRRQQPIGPFVVDFYNSVYRLVVEIDGPIHEFQKYTDQERQEILEMLGLSILRIKAALVERDLPTVLNIIKKRISKLKNMPVDSPSPSLGEGKGGGI